MGRTVRELLPVLTERELTEWAAFDQVEPIGGRRGDYQAAVVASTIANVNRGKKGKAFGVSDFVPEYGKQETPASLEMWLSQRVAEQSYGDPGGQVAPESGDTDQNDGSELVQRAGGDVDDHDDGVGGADADDRGDA